MADLKSGKVKKTPSTEVNPDRYNYIGLSETEPDLGVPDNSDYVLTSSTQGGREWVPLSDLSDQSKGDLSGIDSLTTIDTADSTIWRTLKYTIQITFSGEVHSLEANLTSDQNDLLLSRYGDVFTTTPLADITGEKNNGIIYLKVSPIGTKKPISVKFLRTGIRA
jgi:hypothetical protein